MSNAEKKAKEIVFAVAVCVFCVGGYFLKKHIDNPQKAANKPRQTQAQQTDHVKQETNIGISDVTIIKDRHGDFNLVLDYQFENISSEPKSFALTYADKVFYNGIECQHNYREYDGTEADVVDDITPGTSARILVGYSIRNFKQDEPYEFIIQLSDFKTNKLLTEDKIDKYIPIIYEKVS